MFINIMDTYYDYLECQKLLNSRSSCPSSYGHYIYKRHNVKKLKREKENEKYT